MSQDFIDPRVNNAEMIGEFAEALGLDEAFVKPLRNRGVLAAIDRAETIDETGAQAKMLSMVQRFGMLVDEARWNEVPVTEENAQDAIIKISEQHGVHPELGMMLLGWVHEVTGRVMQDLSDIGRGIETDATPKRTTGPAVSGGR